jgi:hypothetical protein
MAGIEDFFKGESGKGLAIGIGAALLAPVVLPALAGLAKPLARAAIKAGIIAYEKGREAAAEFGEVMEDLVAEARAELEQHHNAATTGIAAGTSAAAAATETTEAHSSAKS